ncbi:glycosyltransferase [Micromonospora tulbaghiae]|uniref:Glycosyl transferases group 1 n=1 Tax=Micromonospora tulbaghiae TaxID=479978 RepID=A0ABY0KPR3_9ACTN|nr:MULTISPECIES: glycosyltransferase [Micromonospora]MCO1614221.1 glycosyltransferase [Micromonospora sp. CPM1]MDX5457280.1 glycosyltransferase [Micromonospora tulbaghiae]SCE98127.1 Glycosyl transferases group 1 [Micromonospora tulbaghiae]
MRNADPEPAPRLLIVSYHFPPAETVGARRPAALAAFAKQQGWDVRVLTAVGADQGGAPVPVPEEHLIRIAPSPRLRRPGRSAGEPVPDGATPPPSRLGRIRSSADRLLVKAGMELLLPDPQLNWIRPPVQNFDRGAAGWRPDVILVSGPPFSGFVVAAALARRLRVPWVADYRDLWSVGNEYWVRSALRRAVDKRLERRVLRTVAACVTVSEPLAETIHRTFGVQTHVVMNGIDRRPVPMESFATSVGVEASATTLTLAHTGYIYPGKRDPSPLIDAIALLGADAAKVHLIFAGEDHGITRAAAERAGVTDSVTLLGQVSPEKSWRIQADADALVLLMWNDPRDAGTVTGKIFDYLQARRPVLLLGYEHGVAARLLRERSAGVVANDPAAIAARLREWLAVKERTGRVPAVPAAALDGLFREDQLGRYLDILRDAARGGVQRPVT